MKWIGLTGGLGTGKSTVTKMLREEGYCVLDADEIAHQVVAKGSPGLKAVRDQFGEDFIDASGNLNRIKMADVVFREPRSLLVLEAIIHPLVQAEVQKLKKENEAKGAQILFYDVPLLFEKNISGFDATILVTTTEENQIQRVQQRNNWSLSEIRQRIDRQMPLAEKEKKADYVLRNDSDKESLRRNLQDLLSKILSS